jgi:hypothetical protein
VKKRILAKGLGVIAIGVAGQDLVHLLGEQRFTGMHDEVLSPRIGQPLGQHRQNAELLVEFAHAQETGIGDNAASLKSDRDLLRTEVP